MPGRLRALWLALLLAGLTACTGGDDDPGEAAPPAPVVEMATAEEVSDALDVARTLDEVPPDLSPPLPFIARWGSLTAPEQSCVLSYGVVQRDTPCLARATEGGEEIVLWGDTHAAQWLPALSLIAAQTGRQVRVLTKFGCPPLLGVTPWLEAEHRPYDDCVRFNRSVVAEVRTLEPEMVVLSGALRGTSLLVDGELVPLGRPVPGNGWRPDPARDRLWQAALARSLTSLRGLDTEVVVLGDTTYPGMDPSLCLPAHVEDLRRCAAKRSFAVHEAHHDASRATARRHGAAYVDPVKWLCTRRTCPPVVGGRSVYRDSFHLGRAYVVWLGQVLGEALGLVEPD